MGHGKVCGNGFLEKLSNSSRNPGGILLDSRSPVRIGGGVKVLFNRVVSTYDFGDSYFQSTGFLRIS